MTNRFTYKPLRGSRGDEDPGIDLVVFHGKDNQKVTQLQTAMIKHMQAHYPDKNRIKAAYQEKGLPIIQGGNVFQMKLCLKIVGASEGLVLPSLKRYKDLVKTIKEHYPEAAQMNFSKGVLIILNDAFDDFGYIAYQCYHWECYHKGLEGYSHQANQLYKIFSQRYKCEVDPAFVSRLDYNELYQLKLAIRRDREALQFIERLAHEVIIPTNNGKQVADGHANA